MHTHTPINLSNTKWDEIFYHSNVSNCWHISAKCMQPTGVEHPGTHLPAGWLELRQTAVSTSRIHSQSSGYSFWRKRYLFSGQLTHTQTSRKYTQKMILLFGPNTPKSQGKWEGFSEEIKHCRKLKSHHFMNTQSLKMKFSWLKRLSLPFLSPSAIFPVASFGMQKVITVHVSLNYSLSKSSLSKGSIKRSHDEHEFLQMTDEFGLNSAVRIFRPTFLHWGHSLSVDMTSAQPPLRAAKVTHRSALYAHKQRSFPP